MAGLYDLENKEVVRIKVKKCDGKSQSEYRKFSVDPQITSFEVLQNILARAFEISCEFTISYLARDSDGRDIYLSMLSDWDMDAAFQCASEPCLRLKIDIRSFEDLEDWDIIAPTDIPQHRTSSFLDKSSILGTITHNLGKTVHSVQRAMGLKHPENEALKPFKSPMSNLEFHNYLDSAGVMIKPSEFRLSIYRGGIEPSLRRVAWRHLLNIYPARMSRQDRFSYLKHKEQQYRKLRDEWRERFQNNTAMEEVKYVASMVKKDVLRTDRSHDFYAGSDENENTISLFNILVTYALTHPDVSYCQGMSDLASPLLVTQNNEAQAYICFCALMTRLRENFTTEGTAIMTKFRHLSELLNMYDPVLYNYLVQNSAEDMFFCYRWFLLELKREFPFNDTLRVLEVMWATLPPNPPLSELALADSDYSSRLLASSPCSPTFSLQHAMYAKLLLMRRVGALCRVTQAAMNIACTNRASANNNLSTEASLDDGGIFSDQNPLLSFDTSPGDGGEADFPEVDDPLTRSLQQKSYDIDQALHDGLLLGANKDNYQEEYSANADSEAFSCNCEIGKSDSSGAFTDSYESHNSPETRHAMYQAHLESDNNNQVDYNTDGGLGIYAESLKHNLGHSRNWSHNSLVSECSDASDQQIQFTLSLDSHSNNSATEICHAASELSSFIHCKNDSIANKGSIKPDSQTATDSFNCLKSGSENNDCMGTKTSENYVHDMKHSQVFPNQQTHSNCWQDVAALPPRPSPQASRQVNRALSQVQETTEILSESHISDCQEATEAFGDSGSTSNSFTSPPIQDPSKLPPPQDLGAGNPFLMFASLTLLTEHRETIFSQGMCYEEIAMHFDRLVRKHDANQVLHHARQLYTEYLRAQQMKQESQLDELDLSC